VFSQKFSCEKIRTPALLYGRAQDVRRIPALFPRLHPSPYSLLPTGNKGGQNSGTYHPSAVYGSFHSSLVPIILSKTQNIFISSLKLHSGM
jgi:hypothetical protein